MKILIVDCLAVGEGRRRFSRDFIGGGPKLIAGVLNQLSLRNLNVKIYRAERILTNKKEKANIINAYDLCLISAMTMDIKSVQKVIKIWRDFNNDKLVIVGGPISSDPDLIKKIDADVVCQGEGEKKIYSIINILQDNQEKINKRLEIVEGIVYRYLGKYFKTKPSNILSFEDLNKYSNPNYFIKNIIDYKQYKAARIYIECLRGCSNFYRMKFPLNTNKICVESCNNCREGDLTNRIECIKQIPPGCGFCSTISNFGFPKSRREKFIIAEIKGLLRIGAKRIVLGGPDFLDYKREKTVEKNILTTPIVPPEPNYKALESLINQIIILKQVKEEKVQIFIENVKASLCTEKALKILAKIPNSIFSIGCETGSEKFAKELGRPFGPSETLKAVKIANSVGIRVQVYFIHSLPGEKMKYLKESIELIDKFYELGVEKITLYKYQKLPGSPFYLIKKQRDLSAENEKQLNRFRKRLVKRAINFNRMRKEEMINNTFRVILAETSIFDDSDAIGYIIRGGPKVLIKNASDQLGKEVDLKIIRMLTDKFVEGEIL